jgi:hypothetical protein
MAGEHPRCDEFVGLSQAQVSLQVNSFNLRVVDAEASEAAAAAGKIGVFHSDHRPNRVNVLVQQGVVTAPPHSDPRYALVPQYVGTGCHQAHFGDNGTHGRGRSATKCKRRYGSRSLASL